MSAGVSADDAPARPGWPLFTLLLVFLAPLLLAWWLARHPDQAGAGSSYGVLITPPRPVPDQELQAMATTSLHPSQASRATPDRELPAMPIRGSGAVAPLPVPRVLHGRWSLVYLTPASCEQDCRRALYLLHQIEQALGKDSLRVQRIVHQEPGVDAPAWPGQWRLERPEALLSRLQALHARGRIYLIDPLGNLMMYYPQDFAPEGLIGDLRRLLKVSRTG